MSELLDIVKASEDSGGDLSLTKFCTKFRRSLGILIVSAASSLDLPAELCTRVNVQFYDKP